MLRAIFACQSRPDPGVFESQVLATGELLSDIGVQFDYHLFEGYRTWLASRGELSKRVAALSQSWHAEIRMHYVPSPISDAGIRRAGRVLARAARKLSTERVLIKARGATAACSAIAARSSYDKIRVLYDCRSDMAAEARLLATDPSRHDDWMQRAARLEVLEQTASRECDLALAVSEPLQQRICALGERDKDTVEVIPCCIATERFSSGDGDRAKIRSSLGFADPSLPDPHIPNPKIPNPKIPNPKIYVYCGSLGSYQVPDELAKLMNALAEKDSNARFLILTGDLDIASQNFTTLQERGLCRVMRVPFDKVPAHLAAADAALLLRRRDPVNRVACPVKFAEYWCSGLPVVVTPEIGDISRAVEETGFGVVVDLSRDPRENATRVVDANLGSLDRETIRQRGIESFGRQTYLPTYSRVFEKLGLSTEVGHS